MQTKWEDFGRLPRKKVCKLQGGLMFHQDNVSAHKAVVSIPAIRDLEFKLLEYPCYSPYLASGDFYLIPLRKKHSRNKNHASPFKIE